MNFISTSKAPQAIGPYSQAIEVGGVIYTSGQIALTPAGEMRERDIEIQTRQVLENLQNVLKEGGGDLQSVVKTTIYLANMDDFTVVNEIYTSYFKGHKPSRSTVAVKTLPKNALIEIDAVALKK